MVVDDDPLLSEIVAEYLRGIGYVAKSVTDGMQALALLEVFQPHCVVMDIQMPTLDGLELCKRLRSRFNDDVVLIAMSGVSPTDPRVAATFATVDHYLQKPFELSDLNKALVPLRG
jgi:two-component system response regulator MprA